jgi:hypothetical protein
MILLCGLESGSLRRDEHDTEMCSNRALVGGRRQGKRDVNSEAGSGPCPVARSGISGVEPSATATRLS